MDLNRVDLNLLVAFDSLVTERSVTRAAERMCVGQSAMSSTLARLRRTFDDRVLVREGREMVPTPLAKDLAGPVHDVLVRINEILDRRGTFDPLTSTRSFTVIASDYVSVMLLTPLLERLALEAPGLRLKITPPAVDYVERVRRGQVDLVVMPREVFTSYEQFPHRVLFSDRFVVAVDAKNLEVGATISLEQFTSMPYQASSCGHEVSPAEAQLDRLGIQRNTEVTTAFGLAPLLLSGTRRVALIHERLAWALAGQSSLRLLEPPMALDPITQVAIWPSWIDADPAHQWLRDRIARLATELTCIFNSYRAEMPLAV
jgi:DNA-binding transcriptional LysR family regulator